MIRRKVLALAGMALVLAVVGNAWGADWTGAVNNDWFEPGNWAGGVPIPTANSRIGVGDPDGPVINAPGALCDKLIVGHDINGSGGTGVLFVEPGATVSLGRVKIGYEELPGTTGDGIMYMNGGTFTATKPFQLGCSDTGDGDAHGELFMTGGFLHVQYLVVGYQPLASGHVQLNGGELRTDAGVYVADGSVALGTGTIDLAGGMLSTNGNVTRAGLWTQPIALGRITGYGQPDPGDASRVRMEYNPTKNRTYVFGIPSEGNPIVKVTDVTVAGPGPILTTVTVTYDGSLSDDFLYLEGPPDPAHVELDGSFDDARAGALADLVDPREALVDLELGYAVVGLDAPGERIRVFFEDEVVADGTNKPEIFILEWAAGIDLFQIQLLTSGPGETPVVAATAQVFSYPQTSTALSTNVGVQSIGGVGINLDALGVTSIRGVQLPAEDGTPGQISGVRPCVVAKVGGCNLPFADADDDGDVDQTDFARFQRCLSGGQAYDPANLDCYCFDRPEPDVPDGDIDERDLAAFLECATGPEVPWNPDLTPYCKP